MRIIRIRAIIEPFKQDECSFICITCHVSADAAYALSRSQVQFQGIVYMLHTVHYV